MRSAQALVVLLLAATAPSGAANASELFSGFGVPIYFEDFDAEIAFPLTPEIDTLVFGGMVGHRVGDPLPLLPTLTGGELLIAVTEPASSSAPLQSSGAAVPVTPPAGFRVGLRGRFDGFEVVSTGQFVTVAVTLFDTAIANGATGYLLDFQGGLLRLAVSNLGPLGFSGYDDVFLSESADEAIRNGDAFEIELLFDQTARTAQAALTVGSEVFQTEATTSATFDAMQIDRALVANTLNNNGAPIATIASDVQDFAIFVPEPGAGAAALASAGALAFGAASRARRGGAPRAA